MQGIAREIPVEVKPEPEAAMTHLVCPPEAGTPRKQSTEPLSSYCSLIYCMGAIEPITKDLCRGAPELMRLWTSRNSRDPEPPTPPVGSQSALLSPSGI